MPRLAVPVTRWMMNGTVLPSSVVVCWISLGRRRAGRVVDHPLVCACCGRRARLDRRLRCTCRRRPQRATGLFWFCVRHSQGWICSPENTGPPIGWFLMVISWPEPSGMRALRRLSPSARPVTSPAYWPFSRTAKLEVMSLPLSVTRTAAASVPGASRAATSASPPEIKSARLDSTSIPWIPAARTAAGTSAATSGASHLIALIGTPPLRSF